MDKFHRLVHLSAVHDKCNRRINHFRMDDGRWYLVDLPGYGYAARGKAYSGTPVTGHCLTSGLLTSYLAFFISISDGRWYLVDLPGYGYAARGKDQRAALKRLIDGYILMYPRISSRPVPFSEEVTNTGGNSSHVFFFLSSLFTFRSGPTVRNGLGFALSHLINLGMQTGLVAVFKGITGATSPSMPKPKSLPHAQTIHKSRIAAMYRTLLQERTVTFPLSCRCDLFP